MFLLLFYWLCVAYQFSMLSVQLLISQMLVNWTIYNIPSHANFVYDSVMTYLLKVKSWRRVGFK